MGHSRIQLTVECILSSTHSLPSGVVTRPHYRVDSDLLWKLNTMAGENTTFEWIFSGGFLKKSCPSSTTNLCVFNSKKYPLWSLITSALSVSFVLQSSVVKLCVSLQAVVSIDYTHVNLFDHSASKRTASVLMQDDKSPVGGHPSYSPVYGLKPRSGERLQWLRLAFSSVFVCTTWIFKSRGALFFCLRFERTSTYIFQKVNPRPLHTTYDL